MQSPTLEFLSQHDGLIITIHQHRYGDVVIALITPSDAADKVISSIEDCNGEYEWELWGLRDSWWPIVTGGTIPDALDRLDRFLYDHKPDWYSMQIGIQQTIEQAISDRHEKCKVKSFDELRDAIYRWSQGDEVDFF